MSKSKIKIIIAFAALYLIWGSTYLAILFAIRSIPPLLMAATGEVATEEELGGGSHDRGALLLRDALVVRRLSPGHDSEPTR